MRTRIFCVVAAVLATLGSSAGAISYNWSFVATGGTSFGEVTGTISGLQVGSNDGSGLSVEVLSSPSGNVLGGSWVFSDAKLGGAAFTIAADKSVTFADARFLARLWQ